MSTECTTRSRDSIGNISETDNNAITALHDKKAEQKTTNENSATEVQDEAVNKNLKRSTLDIARRTSMQVGKTVQSIVKAKSKLRATQSVQEPTGIDNKLQN